MKFDKALGLDESTPDTEPFADASVADAGSLSTTETHHTPGSTRILERGESGRRRTGESIGRNGKPRSRESERRRRKQRRRRKANAGKRLDIQGLRAVAVIAVVINHLTGHPQGGFVGVDVFFVISGYLITGHLLRETSTSGRLSLVDFYKRRVRRLLPAALLTTALTLIGSFFVFGTDRFHSTVSDAVWSTFFAANWRFINTGTDYFQGDTPTSPLQHYWSLSVEEQYYLVWPIALMAAIAIARRSAIRRNAVAIGGLGAGALLLVGSLAWAVHESAGNGVVAYFSTFTRGWELALGSVLAVAAPSMRGSKVTLTVMSWVGLAMIAVSLFVVTERGFPFPGALLPVVGAGLVVSAAAGKERARNVVLTNRGSVYLGDISYSIYLVHFPVIIIAGAAVTVRGAAFYAAVTLAIVGLAVLMYHLVENPIRLSNWLQPRRETGSNIRPDLYLDRALPLGAAFVVGATVIGVLASNASTPTATDSQIAAAAVASPVATGTSTGPVLPLAAKLGADIRGALAATSWPTLSPPLDQPADKDDNGCPAKFQPAELCTWGDPAAAHTIYLVGDSTSGRYNDTFQDVVKSFPGWKVMGRGGAGCPWASTTLNETDANVFLGNCPERNQQVTAEILQVKPDILVMTDSQMGDDYVSSISGELDKVKGSYGKLVLLPAPPQGKNPQDCYTKLSKPADCASRDATYTSKTLPGYEKLAQTYDGTVIDNLAWYCYNGYCPVFAGTLPLRNDTTHLTTPFAHALAPVVVEQFKALKLLG